MVCLRTFLHILVDMLLSYVTVTKHLNCRPSM